MHKILVSTSFLFSIILLLNCSYLKNNKAKEYELKLFNTFKDTCIYFFENKNDTISITREIEIIENTFTDTIILGNGYISGGKKCKMFIAQLGENRNTALYSSTDAIEYMRAYNTPSYATNVLCVYHLKNDTTRKSNEFITLRYKKYIK